jgi:hypothetical protein
MLRRFVGLATVLVGLLFAGGAARAASSFTIGAAGRVADSVQWEWCYGWAVCRNGSAPWPAGAQTGINQRGQAQWIETGGIAVTDRYGNRRSCLVTTGVDPYGTVVLDFQWDCT